MATFNKNISAQTVSKWLTGKSLVKGTKTFIRNCAAGKSDVDSLKSCMRAVSSSINTMYAMVGIIILGVKNRSNAENIKNCLRDAKLTLNKFVNLIYAGEGQKISAYLDSSAGSWFRPLVEQLLTADERILAQFRKKIKSIKLASKPSRVLFSNGLKNLRGLILAVCPGVPVEEDKLYQAESNKDERLENDEMEVLKIIARKHTRDGNKIAAAYRHRIVFNVYRGDYGSMREKIQSDSDLVAFPGYDDGADSVSSNPLKGALYYSRKAEDALLKQAQEGNHSPIRFVCLKVGKLNHDDIAQKIFNWFCKFPHTLVLSKKAVKSIQEESSGVRWKRGVGHKEKSSDQQGFVIGNSRQGAPNLSPRGQEVIKLLGSAPDLLLREFASREEAMKEGYKEAELPGNASANGMVFYKPSDDGKKHIAIVWLYFDVNPQAVASSVREVLKSPRTVS